MSHFHSMSERNYRLRFFFSLKRSASRMVKFILFLNPLLYFQMRHSIILLNYSLSIAACLINWMIDEAKIRRIEQPLAYERMHTHF